VGHRSRQEHHARASGGRRRCRQPPRAPGSAGRARAVDRSALPDRQPGLAPGRDRPPFPPGAALLRPAGRAPARRPGRPQRGDREPAGRRRPSRRLPRRAGPLVGRGDRDRRLPCCGRLRGRAAGAAGAGRGRRGADALADAAGPNHGGPPDLRGGAVRPESGNPLDHHPGAPPGDRRGAQHRLPRPPEPGRVVPAALPEPGGRAHRALLGHRRRGDAQGPRGERELPDRDAGPRRRRPERDVAAGHLPRDHPQPDRWSRQPAHGGRLEGDRRRDPADRRPGRAAAGARGRGRRPRGGRRRRQGGHRGRRDPDRPPGGSGPDPGDERRLQRRRVGRLRAGPLRRRRGPRPPPRRGRHRGPDAGAARDGDGPPRAPVRRRDRDRLVRRAGLGRRAGPHRQGRGGPSPLPGGPRARRARKCRRRPPLRPRRGPVDGEPL
ncbi:MAG: hypothetical protein AVDCRST_MAG49-4060, partial [uncultured Thermomicrobiales bacterium]